MVLSALSTTWCMSQTLSVDSSITEVLIIFWCSFSISSDVFRASMFNKGAAQSFLYTMSQQNGTACATKQAFSATGMACCMMCRVFLKISHK